MVLNHLAHTRILDARLWQPISDALPSLFVDVDEKALGIAANAFGKASLKHEAALKNIAHGAQRLAARGRLNAKPIAMIVNGYSKMRIRNQSLMELLAEQLIQRVGDLNEVDIAAVVNGYARLMLNHDRLFEALRAPTKLYMHHFSTQNLAMIANAHARLQRPDEEILGLVASKLKAQCDGGHPIGADHLPSIVHALVSRLEFCPPDLSYAVAYSLPRVVGQMEKTDLVLTVPPLVNMPGLRTDAAFCSQVFDRCLALMGQLSHGAMTSLVDAASKLGHNCPAFWKGTLRICTNSMNTSRWQGKYVATLALAVAKVSSSSKHGEGTSPGAQPMTPEALEHFLSLVERSALEASEPLDSWDATSLATACVHLGLPRHSPLMEMLTRRVAQLLSSNAPGGAATGDKAGRLLSAMAALGVSPAELRASVGR